MPPVWDGSLSASGGEEGQASGRLRSEEKEEGKKERRKRGGGGGTTAGSGVAGGGEVGDRALGKLGRRASPPESPREATRESGAEGSRRFKMAEI